MAFSGEGAAAREGGLGLTPIVGPTAGKWQGRCSGTSKACSSSRALLFRLAVCLSYVGCSAGLISLAETLVFIFLY